MKVNIRLIYLYLFSFVGLLIAVIGSIRLVELGFKVYVFKGADNFNYYTAPRSVENGKTMPVAPDEEEKQKQIQIQETKRQRQREVAGSLAMLAVGTPLYLYHWKTIQKENK